MEEETDAIQFGLLHSSNISKIFSFQRIINIKIIEIVYILFFIQNSSKSNVYLTLRGRLHSDLPHFNYEVATCGWWLQGSSRQPHGDSSPTPILHTSHM